MTANPGDRSPLFRREAVARSRSDQMPGGLMRITPPWTVGLYLSLMAVFLAAVAVAAFGTVRIHSNGRGVMRPDARVLVVRAPFDGVIASVPVREGDRVGQGQPIMTFDDDELLSQGDRADLPPGVLARQEERTRVRAAAAGIVDRLQVRPGSYVAAGDPLAKIVPVDGALVGHLSLPARDRPYLHAGQTVTLKFDAYPWQEMGVGWGRIQRVGIDADDAMAEAGATAGTQAGAGLGSTVRVTVVVDRLPPGAPAARLEPGLRFSGEITLRTARIYELLLRPFSLTPAQPS